MTFKTLLGAAAVLIFLAGCSTKEIDEFNKPASYWYNSMIDSAAKGNLEKADEYYSSLQSEHVGSPLLAEATMILAMAHMQKEEYLLSEHFLNEYIKRHASSQAREYAEFLKVKAKYMGLPNARRDQGLIVEAIAEGKKFKQNYPDSIYNALVDTMVTRLSLAKAKLNESIASLYDRLDKPVAAAYYRSMNDIPWVDWNDIDQDTSPWYSAPFEGDGGASWYGFLIPDTQSVVSRHADEEAE